MKNAGKTKMMLKSKFSNAVNAIINPSPKKGKSAYQVRRDVENLTNEQKLEMLKKIIDLHMESSIELQSYLYDRRNKKRINKLREEKIATGKRQPKIKMTKAEWESRKAA